VNHAANDGTDALVPASGFENRVQTLVSALPLPRANKPRQWGLDINLRGGSTVTIKLLVKLLLMLAVVFALAQGVPAEYIPPVP
jgi:hypothetical protein